MKQGDKNSLPKGWEMKKLGEVLKIQNGYAFNAKLFTTETGTPLIRIRDIKKGIDTETKFNGLYDRKYEVNAGDFLIGMDGEFGCYEWKGDLALLNQRVCRLQNFSNRINSRFLFYGINKYLKAIEEVTSFATVKHISSKQIEAIKMPLPPIEEQQRIVAKLDEAFEAIEKAKANAEQNIKNAKELFESYLQAIFENKDWKKVKLSELAIDITDGDHMPPPKTKTGIPFITISNINKESFQIDFSETFAVSNEYYQKLKPNRKPRKGDVLYTVTGSYGIPVLIVEDKAFCFQRHIGLIRPKPDLISKLLFYWILSPQAFNQASEMATGTAQKTVSLSSLRNFSVPKIPLHEQQSIVQKLDALSSETKKLEAIYQKKLEDLEELKKSILQKAFSGQL